MTMRQQPVGQISREFDMTEQVFHRHLLIGLVVLARLSSSLNSWLGSKDRHNLVKGHRTHMADPSDRTALAESFSDRTDKSPLSILGHIFLVL